MTATMHIGRRITPNRPRASFRERWDAFALRHFRRVQAVFFAQLHDTLPLDDPDRYALEAPTLEAAFVRLAAEHPNAVTPADGGQAARDADREILLLAACDSWFRDVHGPEYRWGPRTSAQYNRLLGDVSSCFHADGER
ncbi:hypothetical protein [Streptomyces sp. NPDC051452]|uniref:hypothetical protein n=1 Tax=Streptomyces sp. NPDC051452 TaxID=3365654 RepID=UPI0037AEB043